MSQVRTRRPVVAVAYGPRSVAPMQLAEAAAPMCDLLWMVDGSQPEVVEMQTLLRQLGVVVDVGGMEPSSAAAELRRLGPDGVVTYFDAGMVEVAQIAEELQLPFVSPQSATLLFDKLRQRDALRAAGVAVPRYWPLPEKATADELSSIASQIAWPAVLKPRSETGSHNTFLARDEEQVSELLGSLLADGTDMMLEEYLSDDPAWSGSPFANYVSVESVVSHGVTSHVAVTGRFPQAETFRETGFFIPAVLDATQQRAVLELTTAAIDGLGIRFGCLHTEVKFTADGPRIIEVNGRIGFGIPAMLEQAAGFPMLRTSLQLALGEQLSIPGPLPCDRVGYRLFLQPPPIVATVESIDGVNTLADRQGVESVIVHRGPGWRVDWREGTRTFLLAVVGVAKDHDEVREVWRALHDEITVSYFETDRL